MILCSKKTLLPSLSLSLSINTSCHNDRREGRASALGVSFFSPSLVSRRRRCFVSVVIPEMFPGLPSQDVHCPSRVSHTSVVLPTRGIACVAE